MLDMNALVSASGGLPAVAFGPSSVPNPRFG